VAEAEPGPVFSGIKEGGRHLSDCAARRAFIGYSGAGFVPAPRVECAVAAVGRPQAQAKKGPTREVEAVD